MRHWTRSALLRCTILAFFSILLGDPHLIQSSVRTLSPNNKRILQGVKWFNASNSYVRNDEESIVNLTIAFETLFALPKDAKTDRVVDSIALLLGRFPRLESWAAQFYDARSEIVHEGLTAKLNFRPPIKTDKVSAVPEYQSLLLYGRQVFRLCLEALVFGAGLAIGAELDEKLVTKQERFAAISILFDDQAINALDKFSQLARLVRQIERYRFIPETDFGIEKILGAARRVAIALIAFDPALNPQVKEEFQRLAGTSRPDEYETLDAIRILAEIQNTPGLSVRGESPQDIALRLMKAIWDVSYHNYFQLRASHDQKSPREKK